MDAARAVLLPLLSQRRAVYVTLGAYALVAVVYCTAKEIYGPFLRTLVQCSAPVKPGDNFTGSALCGDAHYVLATAQAQEGTLVSFKLAIHGFAAPFLGAMTDTFGRKTVLLISLMGFSLPLGCFWLVSASGIHSFEALLLCFLLSGATNAFDVVFFAFLADLTPDMNDRSIALTLYQFCNAATAMLAQLVAVWVLRFELTSYTEVWGGMLAVLFVAFLYSQRFVHETLVERDAKAGWTLRRKLTAMVQAPLFVASSSPWIQWCLIGDTISTLGSAGMGPVMNTFTMSAYGWRAGDAQLYTWAARPLDLLCLALSALAVGRISPPLAVLAGMAVGSLLGVLRIFSPLSWVFFILPAYISPCLRLLAAAGCGFTSALVPPEKQATMNAVHHLISNVGTSISTYLFSTYLYDPQAVGMAASTPFAVACAAGVVSCLVKVRFILPYVGVGTKPHDFREMHEMHDV